MTGIFITVEGPEGAGKTTLIQQLKTQLENELRVELVLSREPGGNVIAERIRDILLDKTFTQMDGRTEALLYAASRRQHLVDNIVPALQEGKLLICDRFIDSSIAYQGYARRIGVDGIQTINDFAIDGYMPQLTFYIDIDVQEGLRRIREHRQDEVNRLDLESLAFHEAVRNGYLQLAQKEQERIVVLDGMQSPQMLMLQCLTILKQKFPQIFKDETI